MKISVIIPCLNEAECIKSLLQCLQPMRQQGHEIIVVDGGSSDASRALAAGLTDRLLHTLPGRALQMNAGAGIAQGDILWFLHADSSVSSDLYQQLIQAFLQSNNYWGRFDIHLSGNKFPLRVVETFINWRSRVTGIATGDQGIFVRVESFHLAGGFAEIPLMEDVELSKRLKSRFGHPNCLPCRLTTSSRRWESHGIVKTILLMWLLRLRYSLGANPTDLAKLYR